MKYSLYLFSLVAIATLTGCAGMTPKQLGVVNSGLYPCPSSPNCVSSYAQDSHKIAPIQHALSIEQAQARLLSTLSQFHEAKLTFQEPGYVRYEFTSRFFGFVDDVEFLILPSTIEVRSASRLGYSDLGVNRKRIEAIRKAFTEGPDTP